MRVIVVGAGALGASLTFHLARAGADVSVIDAERDGRATSAGAGILCPWLSNVDDVAFTSLYEGGADYYRTLVTMLGDADLIGYRQAGGLFVTADPAELEAMARFAEKKAARSPAIGKVARLSPREARALFPPLAQDLSAVWIAGGARVDGRRLARTLLDAAQGMGARYIAGDAALVVRDGRVRGVHVAGDTPADCFLEADIVAATNGAWGTALLAPLSILQPVTPQRGQILHLRLPNQDTRNWPIILPSGPHYLLAFDAGHIVAGATRESRAGFDYRVTAAGQASLLEQALKVAPGLGEATFVETRVGFRPATPGIRPLLGWVRGTEGLIVGNGLGAGGLTMGPYAGKLLADTILGYPTIDLGPFDPLRTDDRPAPVLR